jgi:hypothetical protein
MEWQPISTTPCDRDLEPAVSDTRGRPHALVFPCRRILGLDRRGDKGEASYKGRAKRRLCDAPGAHDPATYDPRPPRGPTAAANSASPGARRKTGRLICSPEDERRSPITQVFDLPVLFFAAIHQFEQAIGAPHI